MHLNLHGGVAGDMLVAALADAGDGRATLERTLASLPLPRGAFAWALRREQRGGFAGLRFDVTCPEEHEHRHLADVLALLAGAELTPRARAWADAAFHALAVAEGEAHGCAAEEVHFHEVGAVDAIVDVAAACALLDALDVGAIHATAVPVGSGTVHAAHGELPVPAPGTLRLLAGMPICGTRLRGERATPTGVALLRAWGTRFDERPAASVEQVGVGLGAREFEDRANLLRAEVERVAVGQEWLIEFRALVDDRSGEEIGAALDALRAAGAIEAFALAASAKKHRPAFEIVVLADAERQESLRTLCFRHLGTLGLRVSPLRRSRLPRTLEERDTALGRLPFKVRETPDGAQAKPEFDALRARAAAHGLTPREARARLAPGGESHGDDVGA